MLNKKVILAAGLVAVTGCAYYLYSGVHGAEENSVDQSNSMSPRGDSGSSQALLDSEYSISSRDQSEIALADDSPSVDEPVRIPTSAEFLASNVFASPENLNKAFILADGSIKSASLNHVFQHENFADVISKVSKAGYDELSSHREAQLSRQLNSTLGAGVFQSDYSCSGSICALTFQSVNSVSEAELTELAKFDKNYSFANTTTNDLGETTVNVIYIATDDPSVLSMTR